MEDDVVCVCFREECLKCCRGRWFMSTVWISNWKEMPPKAFERWLGCMLRKCRIDYRIIVVEIRNETIKYHDWQEVGNGAIEPMEYELAEIPDWCKPLAF